MSSRSSSLLLPTLPLLLTRLEIRDALLATPRSSQMVVSQMIVVTMSNLPFSYELISLFVPNRQTLSLTQYDHKNVELQKP
jgi:hypothetical protein